MTIPLVRKSLTCLFFENSAFLRQSHASLSHYFSTETKNQTVDAPTVSDFLLHKHHFSPEAASQVASVLNRLKNPEKSDSILSFLKESGFSGTQVEKVVMYRPEFLLANLEKLSSPKSSVNNRLIPSLSVLKGLMGSNAEVAKVLRTSGWFLVIDLEKTLVPNVEFLKSCGISIEQIIRLMPIFPRFFLHKPKVMRKFVEKADEMGVDRSSDDIMRVFRSAPMVFSVSEKKIKKIVEVLLETGKYDMSCIVNNPTSLMYSVENRYKPRLQVLEVLEKRNRLKNWPGFGTMHIMSDKKFFEKFVAPYLDEVGEIYTAKSVQKRR
ncbi:UNVERIFIED_CONTAM: hypothetical protein Scaly_1625200 [Sesamum calycinum]|uniref:Uncharacterized protein n=1 Tax=Sesamum calycinum TaxID=2727403 RepID=A0AAW2P8C2_9LAMI